MAEDRIEGLLGGDTGAAEGEVGVPVADNVALAVSMDAAKSNTEVAASVRAYLEKQTRLVELQLTHFNEERTLAIAAAKRKRLTDRLRIGIQLFLGLAIVGVLVGLAAIVYDALTDRGVKIEAFVVPPHLADQGLTGQVVAKQILDRITELQRGSTTVRAANSFANNWGKDIKVELPETGISIGEISRWIHDSIGRSTRVDGELYYTSAGITVSARVGDYPAIETSGAEADLSKLIQDAATRVYAQTQPYRYGFWLATQGQLDESNAIYRQLYAEGNLADRIWALHGLAINEDSSEKYIAGERRALELDPHFLLGQLDVAQEEAILGHPELALAEFRSSLKDQKGRTDDTLSEPGRESLLANAEEEVDELVGDYQAALLIAAQNTEKAASGVSRDAARQQQARLLVVSHDPLGATDLLNLVPAPTNHRAEARLSALESRLAAERGDWPAALSELERFSGKYPRETHLGLRFRDPGFVAELYARVGRNSEADAIIASIPSDSYDGWRARGRIAALRQDYAEGEQEFAQAVQLAPSFAPAYEEWGNLLRAKGDSAGAISKYSEANHRSPHWADPLKSWGDMLSMQGKVQEAQMKYDEALKYAPNWSAVTTARKSVAKHSF
jgi:tetratricopeptide (TPR) repeat protein